MKKLLSITALAFCVMASGAMAGTTDAYYEKGKIVLPHLKLGNKTYYAVLTLTDPSTLTFRADLTALTDITPPEEVGDTVNTADADIVGTWSFGGDTSVTFFADGTYEQIQAAGEDEESCPNGGIETGTYTWEPSTGILLASVTQDDNGECGLSNPRDGVPLRVFIDGDVMYIKEKGSDAGFDEYAATRG